VKGRYEIRHDTYGRGYRFTDLDRARRELARSVGGGWYIFDRQERRVAL